MVMTYSPKHLLGRKFGKQAKVHHHEDEHAQVQQLDPTMAARSFDTTLQKPTKQSPRFQLRLPKVLKRKTFLKDHICCSVEADALSPLREQFLLPAAVTKPQKSSRKVRHQHDVIKQELRMMYNVSRLWRSSSTMDRLPKALSNVCTTASSSNNDDDEAETRGIFDHLLGYFECNTVVSDDGDDDGDDGDDDDVNEDMCACMNNGDGSLHETATANSDLENRTQDTSELDFKTCNYDRLAHQRTVEDSLDTHSLDISNASSSYDPLIHQNRTFEDSLFRILPDTTSRSFARLF